MRVLKAIAITLVLGSISIASLSCASESETAAEYQVATVQRGSLTVEITASGNLELSVMEDLAFEMAGTVEEVMVEEGDSVEEGQALARLDTSEWEDELAQLELNLLQAEINLENAELALEQAEEETSTSSTGDIISNTTDPKEIEILELRVELAESNYEDAKEALEAALNASPEVTAPFDGFITQVHVGGGDEVKKGTIAVTLADPDRFEADILVSELDIADVELGDTAWIEVDALGVTLSAEVVHISPTATIQSGVVNYAVTVEVQSMETMAQGAPGGMPEGFTPPEGSTLPEDFTLPEGQMPVVTAEDVQLREGMTITVSLIVEEATDVLLVPNGAITTAGGQTYVQVLLDDGTTEQRVITTGISDWQYTEVTEGLSEGEQVLVPEGTTTTSTTEQQDNFPDGGMMIPGMGGF
jgi:RND family efflux transporter MFP subunit